MNRFGTKRVPHPDFGMGHSLCVWRGEVYELNIDITEL